MKTRIIKIGSLLLALSGAGAGTEPVRSPGVNKAEADYVASSTTVVHRRVSDGP